MITITGQLAIETRHGRYGDFNVGQLRTSIGQFSVKDPELDQYPQGKYDGEFIIVEIRPQTYQTSGRVVFEMRAYLGGMTLSNIDSLTEDDARKLHPQEPDPIEQDPPKAATAHSATPEPAASPEPSPAPQIISAAPVISTAKPENPTPKAEEHSAPEAHEDDEADMQLFGPLWPLADRFKLDTTIDRRRIRQQVSRLDALNYEIDPNTQEWHRKAA